MGVFLCPFDLDLFPRLPYNVGMKDKEIKIRADEGFVEKVDYLKRINGYQNRSETIRKTVEKEYRKEHDYIRKEYPSETCGVIHPTVEDKCPYSKDGRCMACNVMRIHCDGFWFVNCEQFLITKGKEKDK